MTVPASIRSTAGFRKLQIFELNTDEYPVGAQVLEPMNPYTVSGSVISGSSVSIPAGTAISGSIGYYGMVHSGAKVLTINDPAPRVIPHTGDDGVFGIQVLPPLEPISGELRTDKTNDTIDALIGAVKKFTVGEATMLGIGTNKRGFENQVAVLAYAFAEDTDPNSASFGRSEWDFRLFSKVNLFMRETGYQQEANEKMYTFTPSLVTKHIWGTQFTEATEGFTRAQAVRGVSQYKPTFVTFIGDASTVSFPFDSDLPAVAATKVAVWKNGVLLSTGYTASVRGVVFTAAPAALDIIVVFYEA